MDFSIHKIKFNKSVCETKITKISKLLLNKQKITIKKLVKSNDVEHLPAKFFVAKSFKREKHPGFVVIIGRLKPSHISMHGAGLSDIFNKIKSTVSNVFSVRNEFNNKAQAMLKQYGDRAINSLSIFRAPINQSPLFVKVINGLSSQNIPYEKLFHLGFIITIGGTKLRVEKNEVIGIDDVFTSKPETEFLEVPIQGRAPIIFNDFFNNAVNKFGKDRIFKYSAFQYNCQCYVRDVLEANLLYSPSINNFVYQPLESVNKNTSGAVPKMANAITSAAAYVNKLIGGNKNNLSNEELKILMKVLKMLEHN